MQFICGILFHNISIHALCEEGDPQGCSVLRTEVISIHALCEEGDPAATPSSTGRYDFYPRPLRGGRLSSQMFPWDPFSFLSTPSARRATLDVLDVLHPDAISIHALCEEGDFWISASVCGISVFLSTPSARRATGLAVLSPYSPANFYPRPLRGGRPFFENYGTIKSQFLSTPSARRATKCHHRYSPSPPHFYPRPLRGGRQQKQRQNLYFQTNYTTFCTNLEEP